MQNAQPERPRQRQRGPELERANTARRHICGDGPEFRNRTGVQGLDSRMRATRYNNEAGCASRLQMPVATSIPTRPSSSQQQQSPSRQLTIKRCKTQESSGETQHASKDVINPTYRKTIHVAMVPEQTTNTADKNSARSRRHVSSGHLLHGKREEQRATLTALLRCKSSRKSGIAHS